MFNCYDIDTLVKESGSYLINLLITIIGTLLGFLGAFYLTNLSEKKQRNKEKRSKLIIHRNRLEYFILLMEKSILAVRSHIKSYDVVVDQISKGPTKQPELRVPASNYLERIQKINTEDIFQAFYFILPEGSDPIKRFNNIYSSIDLLSRTKDEMDTQIKEYFKNVYNDIRYISEFTHGLGDCILTWIREMERSGKVGTPDYLFLTRHRVVYEQLNKKNEVVGNYKDSFLIPFAMELRAYFSSADYYRELDNLASKAIRGFNPIKEFSDFMVKLLIAEKKKMDQALDKLSDRKDSIRTDINNFQL